MFCENCGMPEFRGGLCLSCWDLSTCPKPSQEVVMKNYYVLTAEGDFVVDCGDSEEPVRQSHFTPDVMMESARARIVCGCYTIKHGEKSAFVISSSVTGKILQKGSVMKILNLTQHKATPDQLAVGVVDTEKETSEVIKKQLTFDDIPSQDEMMLRASVLFDLARLSGCDAVMIGGAPFFMPVLEKYFIGRSSFESFHEKPIRVCYAFSKRESVETPQPDGSVKKEQVFRHVGFVWAV